jgi:hypothetical protein
MDGGSIVLFLFEVKLGSSQDIDRKAKAIY